MRGRKRRATIEVEAHAFAPGDRVLVRYETEVMRYPSFYEQEVTRTLTASVPVVQVDSLTPTGDPQWVHVSRLTLVAPLTKG